MNIGRYRFCSLNCLPLQLFGINYLHSANAELCSFKCRIVVVAVAYNTYRRTVQQFSAIIALLIHIFDVTIAL